MRTIRLEEDGTQYNPSSPYKALWLAVILQAATDYAKGKDKDLPTWSKDPTRLTAVDFRGAKNWLFSDEDGKGSFVWACTINDLNHFAVRRAILKDLKRFKRAIRHDTSGKESKVRQGVQCTSGAEKEPSGAKRSSSRDGEEGSRPQGRWEGCGSQETFGPGWDERFEQLEGYDQEREPWLEEEEWEDV